MSLNISRITSNDAAQPVYNSEKTSYLNAHDLILDNDAPLEQIQPENASPENRFPTFKNYLTDETRQTLFKMYERIR